MNVIDLFAERFEAYFNDAHTGDPLWLFVHVPKTAGSSLNGELQPLLSPSHHIFIDYGKLDANDAGLSYEQLFDRSVDRFIDMAKARRYRYCTGHINAAHVQRIVENVPHVRPVTLLRDPLARYISDYRYQCSAMHPGHEQFAAQYPTLRDYVGMAGDWNKISTTLLPTTLRESADAGQCVDWLLRTYAFIGLQEMYSLSLHALTWFAGVPRHSRVRRRINTPTPETHIEVSDHLIDEIRYRNSLDVALFEAIAPRFEAVSPALTLYLDRVAPRPKRP